MYITNTGNNYFKLKVGDVFAGLPEVTPLGLFQSLVCEKKKCSLQQDWAEFFLSDTQDRWRGEPQRTHLRFTHLGAKKEIKDRDYKGG